MVWLKTYAPDGSEAGQINSDQVLAFDVVQDNSPNDPGPDFGVFAMAATTGRLVTPGYPHETRAEAMAAIDDIRNSIVIP